MDAFNWELNFLSFSSLETVFVESVKEYLGAPWDLWWKRKYLQIQTTKKISEKLLCDVWLPLTELQLYFMELFANLISVESENWYFEFLEDYRAKENILRSKGEKAFSETSLWSANSSHRVTAFPSRSRSLRLFLWNLQSDIWKPMEVYGEKGSIVR